jgi:hypothetical protein
MGILLHTFNEVTCISWRLDGGNLSYSSYIIARIQPLSTIICYNIYITTKSCCQISLLVNQSTHYWDRLLILVWHEVRLERKVQTQVMFPIDMNWMYTWLVPSRADGYKKGIYIFTMKLPVFFNKRLQSLISLLSLSL